MPFLIPKKLLPQQLVTIDPVTCKDLQKWRDAIAARKKKDSLTENDRDGVVFPKATVSEILSEADKLSQNNPKPTLYIGVIFVCENKQNNFSDFNGYLCLAKKVNETTIEPLGDFVYKGSELTATDIKAEKVSGSQGAMNYKERLNELRQTHSDDYNELTERGGIYHELDDKTICFFKDLAGNSSVKKFVIGFTKDEDRKRTTMVFGINSFDPTKRPKCSQRVEDDNQAFDHGTGCCPIS